MTDESFLSESDQQLLDALHDLPPLSVTPGLAAEFHRRLAAEAGTRRSIGNWIIVSMAAALFVAVVAGWWIDRNRREGEIAALRAELSRALATLPAPGRFEAVNNAGNSKLGDDSVVTALIHALLADSNTNVRVAAAAALGRIATPAALAEAARRSFGVERSPFVQTEMLRSVQRLNAALRARIVGGFLGRRDLDSTVRLEAQQVRGL
jgi:hypothetical protein